MLLRVVGFAAAIGLFIVSLFFLILGILFLPLFGAGIFFILISWGLVILSLTSIVAALRRSTSRKLGAASVVAGSIFLIIFILLSVEMTREPEEAFIDIRDFLFIAWPHLVTTIIMIVMGLKAITASRQGSTSTAERPGKPPAEAV